MGNVSPRNAKVFSYSSAERKHVPSLLPDWVTVKSLLGRQDWRGLQGILADNEHWLRAEDKACWIEGRHPLHLAIVAGAPAFIVDTLLRIDPQCAQLVLDTDTDTHTHTDRDRGTAAEDEKGFYPLHLAAKHGSAEEIIQLLIDAEPSICAKPDAAGRLPLHVCAASGGGAAALQCLLAAFPAAAKVRSRRGDYPLHCALAGRCSLPAVQALLQCFPEAARQSSQANLPLHIALSQRCSLEVFQEIVSHYPNAVCCHGEEAKLPLHIAVANKCTLDVLRALISLNPEALEHRDKSARMPLHIAIDARLSEEAISLLVESAPQTLRCRGRGTPGDLPLASAIEKKLSASIVLALLQGYPDAAKQKTVYGMFPLRAAMREQLPLDVLVSLLRVCPEAAREIDEHGRVALHYAVSRDYPFFFVEALLEAHPEGAAQRDRNGQFPLHIACTRLCALQTISALLERNPSAAHSLDRFRCTPLHYVIENDGALTVYEALLTADPVCAQRVSQATAASQTEAEGKLPLHHAIECARPLPVLQLLTRVYPEACGVAQRETNKLALHLAILRPLPIEALLFLEETFPAAARVADFKGLSPAHYAIRMKTDAQLLRRLLHSFPELVTERNHPVHLHIDHAIPIESDIHREKEGETEVESEIDGTYLCCSTSSRLLLHFAIDSHTTPENVAEILPYSLPFAEDGTYRTEHGFVWTHILAHTHDKFWRSVEIALKSYSAQLVSQLSEFRDEKQRKAIDVATPRCRSVLLRRLHFNARYELIAEPFHRSSNSLLKRAIDHFQGRKSPVFLKFLSCETSFLHEVKLRERVSLDERFVVPLVQSLNGDEDANYRKECAHKRFQNYRYLIVTAGGGRSLEEMIKHEALVHLHPQMEQRVKHAARQILRALAYLHSHEIVHGNLHPGHVINCDGKLKLLDFSFSSLMPLQEKVRLDHGRRALSYAAPEIAKLALLRAAENETELEKERERCPLQHPSMDMWSFAAILFFLCTGEELFLPNFERGIDRDQLELLAQWPLFAKRKRLKKIADPLARNLIDQLLSVEVRLRPSAEECLVHPFLRVDEETARLEEEEENEGELEIEEMEKRLKEETYNDEKKELLSESLSFRYVGMSARFDVFLSFRHTALTSCKPDGEMKHLLQRGVNHVIPIDDAIHCHELAQFIARAHWRTIDSSSAIDKNDTDENGSKNKENNKQTLAVYDAVFRRISQSRSLVAILSRFAVNCEDLDISALTKSSPLHPFLFELRAALELLSRGLLEGGLFVIAIGDCSPTQPEMIDASNRESECNYGPFFAHFQQEMTHSAGNCFPSIVPDVVVEAEEEAILYCLRKHGLGALHFPRLTVRSLFQRLLRMPIIHVQGPKEKAVELASDDLLAALQQRLGGFRSSSVHATSTDYCKDILAISRPHTSAFQRMLDTRIPSPEFNRRTPAGFLRDREPVPNSPLHGLSISEVVQQYRSNSLSRGGSLSRGESLSRRGRDAQIINQSLDAEPFSGEAVGQDVQFFDSSLAIPQENSFLQMHEQNASSSSLPFFTELVSLDKSTSEQLMHFLVEKVEVRDSEVNNLVLELALMEERMRLQQREIQRLRRLVRVTDTLDMDRSPNGEEEDC